MKTFIATIAFAFLLLYSDGIKAQGVMQNNQADYYWKKHKTFKTLGWVSIGVGIPLTLVGAVSSIASADNPRVKQSTADVLAASGLLLTASSIPFFILSHKYKKKAKSLSLSLKSERIDLPYVYNQPAVSLSISF